MITFNYTARDPKTGNIIKANVQADNEQEAAKLIMKTGMVPVQIKSTVSGLSKYTSFLNRVRAKDRVLFARQLSTLINAGLPIVQSLRSVSEQTSNKALQTIINQLVTDVEAGSALSAAMLKHPKVFNQVFTSLIAAGETSGTLDKALERLAIQQEKDAELVSKIRGAMSYPIIVVLVMVLVLGFMLVKVLPQVQILYAGLKGASLPLLTRVLIGLSHAVIKGWWIVILLVIGGSIGVWRFSKTKTGRSVIDTLKMKAWPIGNLFMKVYMARFARTGSTLVASGVPLIQMLEITGKAVNNVHVEDSLKKAIEKVKGGKALSDALQNDKNFLTLVPNMLKIGEQSGAMEAMLGKTADYYEREVDDQIKAISTIIEPVLMVVLGVVAFIIVAAVLLPIYGLAGQSFVQV